MQSQLKMLAKLLENLTSSFKYLYGEIRGTQSFKQQIEKMLSNFRTFYKAA